MIPSCARNAHWPSVSTSRAGHPAQQIRCMSSGVTSGTAHPGRTGAGGTTLAAVTAETVELDDLAGGPQHGQRGVGEVEQVAHDVGEPAAGVVDPPPHADATTDRPLVRLHGTILHGLVPGSRPDGGEVPTFAGWQVNPGPARVSLRL